MAGDLERAIKAGDRRAIGRAITLVESTRPDHRAEAAALLDAILPATGGAMRLGITGVPGVGKSTFIESFGGYLIGEGLKVAVVAVDPSSRRSGGSILGDKTRMPELAKRAEAFIRPSPSAGTLGGVARRTRETMLILEAAGFDVVIVETVGVGQSETAVADMVDMFCLMLTPAGGDELQGLKKGIVEMADLILINKADGDLQAAANRAAAEYAHALELVRPPSPGWAPRVMTCSAVAKTGVPEVWATVQDFRETLSASGALDEKRAEQARAWLWDELREGLIEAFMRDPAVKDGLKEAERAVRQGRESPTSAAQALLKAFLGGA